MKPQKKSLTAPKTGRFTPPGSSLQPSISQGTWNLMREMEAKEWLNRFREKLHDHGPRDARLWWAKTIADIDAVVKNKLRSNCSGRH